MYKWSIDIVLKSGYVVNCEYDGPEMNSGDVANTLFHGKKPNDWIGLASCKGTHNKFIVAGEIASIDIYERKDRLF